MSMKRKFEGTVTSGKRKHASPLPNEHLFTNEGINFAAVGCDTSSALQYIRNMFPVQVFDCSMPPIILQHQLYAVLKNRTSVDKELGQLRDENQVRLFNLGSEEHSSCVVFLDDYKSHVLQCTKDRDIDHQLISRFLSAAVTQCNDVSFSKQRMTSLEFNDSNITQLVRAGVLTVRDVGSWWLAIPNAGIFTKALKYGRRSLLSMLKRCKYQEILQSELEKRRLPKDAKLGIQYHMLDILGADVVDSVSTTSGPLLRLRVNQAPGFVK